MRQDFRLDKPGDPVGIAGLNILVLPDCRDDVLGQAFDKGIRARFLRRRRAARKPISARVKKSLDPTTAYPSWFRATLFSVDSPAPGRYGSALAMRYELPASPTWGLVRVALTGVVAIIVGVRARRE